MSQIETIIGHVDAQQKRLYDPLKVDVDSLKADVKGNGKDGLITKVRVMENNIKVIEDDMHEIKEDLKALAHKVDSMQWKLAGVMAGVSLLTQILFNYVF